MFDVEVSMSTHNYLNSEEEIKSLSKELADIKWALDVSTIVAITDQRGIITQVNDIFCELSKYSRDELIGQDHRILNSGYHSKEFFRNMWKTIASGKVWKGELRNKTKDGSLYWVHTTIVPFLNKHGKPYQYVSIRSDITDKKEIEIQLQKALKENFLHTVKKLQNGIFKLKKSHDGKLIYTMAEGQLMEELGVNSEYLIDKTPTDAFPPDIASLKEFYYGQAFKGERVHYEVELKGKLLYVDVSPLKQGDKVTEIVGSVHDITELRSTQKKLTENLQHYQSLFKHSQDTVILFDTNGKIIDMNPKTVEKLGYTKEDFVTKPITDLILDDFKELRINSFREALQGKPQNFDTALVNKDGDVIHFNISYLPIFLDNEISGIFSIAKDITDQKRVEKLNAYLANHDELTKLPNRRWMEQALHEAIIEAETNNQKIAVLFIDLDRFKHINDTLGHFIGDRLLEGISKRLLETVKDIHPVARMGGDEFMVFCPYVEQSVIPIQLAKELLQTLAEPVYIEGYELFITLSIGISTYPTDGTTVVDLMKKADIALYQAKDEGRNTFKIYASTMDRSNYQSFILERDLRKAVKNNEFVAYFQPRVDASTKEILGAEALIRWKHPKLGLIPPSEFIPLAEETGLIIPIGKWMKKRVCEQLVAWREIGIPLIPISVNISSQRFLQKDFSLEVRQLLNEYQLEGKWLEFEITENSMMRNEEYIIQTLKQLKELGIKIYVDDFGTGYSSFNYLRLFQLDGIKIDRSFIRNISSESENAAITTAMIQMAHHLKLEVIAEGVETEEELFFLREHHCHQVQGYLFYKPSPIEEFESVLQLKGSN
jgi:diguanylate cyclase (GGDEF)-like protein/PAS domain S-box-containing protein